MAYVNITARLEQLTCPDCANMITSVVGRLKGVEQAEVRYATSKLLVRFDESLITWEAIEKTLAKLGYLVKSKVQQEG